MKTAEINDESLHRLQARGGEACSSTAHLNDCAVICPHRQR